MSEVSIIRPPASEGASIEQEGVRVFTFDATIQEAHAREATPTTHPIETGAEVTDHVRLEPERLTLTGIVTNTPFVEVLTEKDRDFVAWEKLEGLLEGRQPMTVVTPIKTYSDMALISVQLVRAAATGQSIQPVLTFQKLTFVDSMVVDIPPEIVAPPARASGSSSGDAGRTQGQDPSEAENERRRSWAAQAWDSFRGR